jgi:beta-lactamase regulating signal transducer with metallopeptidase domain
MMTADLFSLLVRIVLALSAALVIVLALRTPMRAAFGARAAYGLWLLAPAAFVASLLPARVVGVGGLPTPQAAPPASPVSELVQIAADGGASPALDIAWTRADASPFIIAIWLLGVVISLMLLANGQRRFAARLGAPTLEKGVHVAASESIGPAVIGIVAPRIVVPADFNARYTELEQSLVIEHERAHIRAGDLQVNALAAFTQCVFWFNPLVYVARAALSIDQELACDERVMQRHGASRRAYAEAMLKAQFSADAAPLGCAWPPVGAQPLKQRIAALGRPRVAPLTRAAGAGVCLAAALTMGAAAWIAQPPRYAYADDLERGASLFGRSEGAHLVQALMDGNLVQARALIAAGADVDHWTPGDGTPLIMAARLNDAQIAADLLAAGADVNKPARGEGNALIVAAAEGHLDIVRLFVGAGADVNAVVPADETPLINAAWNGHVEIARYLIERGADPNLAVRAPTVDGAEMRSPLIMARRGQHAEMVALLQSAGARD